MDRELMGRYQAYVSVALQDAEDACVSAGKAHPPREKVLELLEAADEVEREFTVYQLAAGVSDPNLIQLTFRLLASAMAVGHAVSATARRREIGTFARLVSSWRAAWNTHCRLARSFFSETMATAA